MLFTVETVSCLGACGLAPVMLVDEEVHGQITPEAAVKIVDELLEQEKREKEMA
jgi:NADH-quinone oxidoreductase subunit E